MNKNSTQDAAKNLIDIANILNSAVSNKDLLPLLPNQHQAKALDKLYEYEKQINLIELNLNQYQNDDNNIVRNDILQLIKRRYGCHLNENTKIGDAKKFIKNNKPIPYTATNLVQDLISDKSSVSSLLQRLEVKGLINRENNQTDNRIKELSLTKSGVEICNHNNQVYETLAQYLNPSKEIISAIITLNEFLNKNNNLINSTTNNPSKFSQTNDYENRNSQQKHPLSSINNQPTNQKW